jgi:hypothetical protein
VEEVWKKCEEVWKKCGRSVEEVLKKCGRSATVFSIIIVIFESINNTTEQAKVVKRVVKHDVFLKFSIGA